MPAAMSGPSSSDTSDTSDKGEADLQVQQLGPEAWGKFGHDSFRFYLTQLLTLAGSVSVEGVLDILSKGDARLRRVFWQQIRELQRLGLVSVDPESGLITGKNWRFKPTDPDAGALLPLIANRTVQRKLLGLSSEPDRPGPYFFFLSKTPEIEAEVDRELLHFRSAMRRIGAKYQDVNSTEVLVVQLTAAEMHPFDYVTVQHDGKEAQEQDVARQVAHDMKPLVAALNSIETEISQVCPESATSRLRAVARSIEEMVKGLLDGEGREWESASVDLSKVLEDVRKSLSHRFDAQAVSLQVIGSLDVRAQTNASTLRRVLTNLIVNALDALDSRPSAQSEGTIQIEVSTLESQVQIEVRDNGGGMSPSQVDAVRSGIGFSTKSGGHGMGLRTSIERIRGWGGDILVESVEGQGTTFQVLIPRAN